MVLLEITYLFSNWSDQVLTNSIAHRWTPVVNISDKINSRELPKRVVNLLLSSINRGLLFLHCHLDYHAFTSYSTQRKLVKIWNVLRNLSSWFSATLRGISLSSTNLYFNFELFAPLLGLTRNIELSFYFIEMGWFPIQISCVFFFFYFILLFCFEYLWIWCILAWNVMLNVMVLMSVVLVFQLSMFLRMLDLLYNSGAQ